MSAHMHAKWHTPPINDPLELFCLSTLHERCHELQTLGQVHGGGSLWGAHLNVGGGGTQSLSWGIQCDPNASLGALELVVAR